MSWIPVATVVAFLLTIRSREVHWDALRHLAQLSLTAIAWGVTIDSYFGTSNGGQPLIVGFLLAVTLTVYSVGSLLAVSRKGRRNV